MKTQRLALLVTFFLLVAMIVIHTSLGGTLAQANTLSSLCLGIIVSRLCVIDSRILRKPMVHAAQWTMFFTWPISAPVYLIWRRGAKGLIILICLAGSLLVLLVGIAVLIQIVAVVLRVGHGMPHP